MEIKHAEGSGCYYISFDATVSAVGKKFQVKLYRCWTRCMSWKKQSGSNAQEPSEGTTEKEELYYGGNRGCFSTTDCRTAAKQDHKNSDEEFQMAELPLKLR